MIAFISDPDDIEPQPDLLYATMTVRDQIYPLLSLPDAGRRSRRLLRRERPLDAQIPHSQTHRRRRNDARLSACAIIRFCTTRACTPASTGRAPIGTPILAAGNGVIIKADYNSGYGRHVEIQHANGYVTTYKHMSGFARGMPPGVHVTQGQVIGYLGQSGLATGPHLHYEVIINGNFVDPMAIKLARTREFDGKMLAPSSRSATGSTS